MTALTRHRRPAVHELTRETRARRRHKIDPASIVAGVFMRDLTDAEVIAHLMSNQGVALSRQGKLDEAIARYDAALELHSTLLAAHYNRGLDLMNAARLQEALASFDRAIELHAADAQAYNNRGLAKLKLGDREGAWADFARALEIEPSLKEAECSDARSRGKAGAPSCYRAATTRPRSRRSTEIADHHNRSGNVSDGSS